MAPVGTDAATLATVAVAAVVSAVAVVAVVAAMAIYIYICIMYLKMSILHAMNAKLIYVFVYVSEQARSKG
jgi:hypothetical protein